MSRPRSVNSVSLFPFLAVLVCAMGALIFLLIVTTQRIRSDAVAAAKPVKEPAADIETPTPEETLPTPQTSELEEPAVIAEQPVVIPTVVEPPVVIASIPAWPGVLEPGSPLSTPFAYELPRSEPPTLPQPPPDPALLQRFRRLPDPEDPNVELQQQLATLQNLDTDWRNALAAEEQRRRIAADLLSQRQQELKNALAAVSADQTTLSQLQESADTLAGKTQQIRGQLANVTQQINTAARQKADAPAEYAIVPFKGRTGTNMRPVFVELTDKGVRFLPEDILLTKEDFVGFTVAVNPLLAGTEALLDYWRQQSRRTLGPEPYVLLVIRPSGSRYFSARRLLGNLNGEMGYELIEENLPLRLPPRDPEAAAKCQAAVDNLLSERRKLQEILAARNISPDLPNRLRVSSGGRGGLSNRQLSTDASKFFAVGENAGNAGENSSNPAAGQTNSRPGSATSGDNAGNERRRTLAGLEQFGQSPVDRLGSRFAAERAADRAREAGRQGTGFPRNDQPGNRSPGNRQQGFGESRNGQPGSVAVPPPSGQADGTGDAGNIPLAPPSAQFTDANSAQPGNSRQRGTAADPMAGNPNANRPDNRNRPQSNPDSNAGNEPAGDRNSQPSRSSNANGTPGANTGGQSGNGDGDSSNTSTPPLPDFAQLYLRQKFSPDTPVRRRWGLSDPRASIGFERTVNVDVSDDAIVVNNAYLIRTERAQTPDQLIVWTLEAIERTARTWGNPPTSIYWVPVIKFRVVKAGVPVYQKLSPGVAAWGLEVSAEAIRETTPAASTPSTGDRR